MQCLIARPDPRSIELAHPGRQVRLGRLDQHVEVVAHQAPRVTPPVEPRAHLAQNRQPLGSIQVVDKNRFAAVTARGDVIKRLCKLKAQGTGHPSNLGGSSCGARPDPK